MYSHGYPITSMDMIYEHGTRYLLMVKLCLSYTRWARDFFEYRPHITLQPYLLRIIVMTINGRLRIT